MDEQKTKSRDTFCLDQNLRRVLEIQRISVKRLSRQTGVSCKTIYGWLQGRVPNLIQVRRVALYLNMSVDNLAFNSKITFPMSSYELVLYKIDERSIREKLFQYFPKA